MHRVGEVSRQKASLRYTFFGGLEGTRFSCILNRVRFSEIVKFLFVSICTICSPEADIFHSLLQRWMLLNSEDCRGARHTTAPLYNCKNMLSSRSCYNTPEHRFLCVSVLLPRALAFACPCSYLKVEVSHRAAYPVHPHH